jgi:hypothetical protein
MGIGHAAVVTVRVGRRLVVSTAVAVAVVASASAPSPVSATLDGPCTVTATFQAAATTVDARVTDDEPIEIRRADSVLWEGSVSIDGVDRPASGYVAIDLPPPLGRITIESWTGPTSVSARSGTYDYDLGPWIPAGAPVRVFGEHRENGLRCSGSVIVAVAGSPFTSPVTYAALGATALVGFAFIRLIRPLWRRVPR